MYIYSVSYLPEIIKKPLIIIKKFSNISRSYLTKLIVFYIVALYWYQSGH